MTALASHTESERLLAAYAREISRLHTELQNTRILIDLLETDCALLRERLTEAEDAFATLIERF